MKFAEQLTVTLLAAFSGVLGNLIAAFIQAALGQITLLQVVFMLGGVVLVAVISYTIENRKRQQVREVEQLRKDLGTHRSRLRSLQSRAESGAALTSEAYDEWYEHQAEIATIKDRLRELEVAVNDEFIDVAPAPKAPVLVRVVHWFRSMGMLSVILVAFVLSFPLSVAAQAVVINLWNIPVEPDLVGTPTPFLPDPTEELVATEELAPTEAPLEEPTEFPVAATVEAFPEPTEEAVPELGTTPTAEAVDAGQGTPTGTPPPTPASTVSAALRDNGGGGLEFSAVDLNQPRVFVGGGTGSLTGRAVWDAQPVEGVKIGLTEGVDSGLRVIAVATTDGNGRFQFLELEAKQYGLIVEPPEGYSVGFDYCGRDVDHPVETFSGLRYPSPIVADNATRDVGDIKLAAEAVTAVYPIGGVVVTGGAPILRWEPYPGAGRYIVCLFGIPGLRFNTSQPFVDLSKSNQVDPGAIYWKVYAFTNNGLVGYSARNDFLLNE